MRRLLLTNLGGLGLSDLVTGPEKPGLNHKGGPKSSAEREEIAP